ncbi:helix-turn-helix domain-containing protein [Bacillus sp. Hm123]|uniref:helix-turn-helix domain-containing protein n=1 Tax=Bacillus sp. Hm123 TaxID=3450745 RepID=UPI003F42266B
MLLLTELGNRLREARKAKGLSLADVQEMTKIQKRYLTGIEEGNYDMMPGKFYVRAFIKQYAEAVGLNPDELFEEFKSEVPSSHEDEIPQRATKVEPVKSKVPTEPSKLLEHLPKILVTTFVIGALFLVWVLMPKNDADEKQVVEKPVVKESTEQNNEDEGKEEAPAKEEKEVKEEPKVEEPAKPVLTAVGASGSDSTYELKEAEKFELTISSKGSTWVGVKDGNGKSHFGDMIPKGQTQTFDLTGQTEAKIRVGNAVDTEIKVNGEVVTYQIPAASQVTQNIIIQKK